MASPNMVPGMGQTMYGQHRNPAIEKDADSGYDALSLGKQGEQHVAAVHGPYGVMAMRSGTFFATVTTAAVAIPVNTTTSASTFAVVNPAASGVNMEMIDFKLDFLHTNAAPATANCIGLSFVAIAGNAVSAITKAPVVLGATIGSIPGLIGNGAVSVGYVATAITFASALTVASNWGYPMYSFPASWVPTVGGYPVPLIHEFKGKIMLPPGTVATLVASTAWAANTVIPSVSWAEYPI